MHQQLDQAKDPIREEEIESFKQVFETYYEGLYRFALVLVQQEEVARGLVQDMFLKIWEKRDQLPAEDRIKTYLFTGMHRRALNWIRHEKITRAFENNSWQEWMHLNQAPPEINPFLKEALAEAIDGLPDRARDCFHFTQIMGLSLKETAKEMDISEKTVENQLGIARKKLQKKLRRYYL